MEEPNNDFTRTMRLAFIHDNLKASKDPKSNFLKRSQKLAELKIRNLILNGLHL